MNKLGKRIETDIKRFAVEEYPKEACGVLTKQGKKLQAVKCVNVADRPEDYFVIASDEYRALIDSTGVYGIWHTHVNDRYPLTASQTDIAACNATGVDWVIIDIIRIGNKFVFGDFFSISPVDEDDSYLERTYIYGVRDCFTLLRDYYQKEFTINIDFRPKGYPEVMDWQYKGLDLLSDSYQQAGFCKLINQQPMVGDVFLIQLSSNAADHVAIYIGDDKILHHCQGRLSTIDIYGGGYFWKHTVAHLRHHNFLESTTC